MAGDREFDNRSSLDAGESVFEAALSCGFTIQFAQLTGVFDAPFVALVDRIVHIVVEPGEDQTGEYLLVRAMQLTHLFKELLSAHIPVGVCEVGGNLAEIFTHTILLSFRFRGLTLWIRVRP